jgi:hypothetical protein
MRYAKMRGRAKVQEQCLFTAIAQNIKKIALVLSRKASSLPDIYTFLKRKRSVFSIIQKPLLHFA